MLSVEFLKWVFNINIFKYICVSIKYVLLILNYEYFKDLNV